MSKHPLFDNPVFQVINKVLDSLALSLLWTLASLPLFTIGAASAALYTAMHKSVFCSEGYVWRTFWSAFRANWKQATVLWLLMTAISGILFADLYLFNRWSTEGIIPEFLFWAVLVLAFCVLVWVLYWFAYLARYNDSIRGLLRNTLLISLVNLGVSVPQAVLFFLLGLIVYSVPEILVLWLFLPAGFCAVNHTVAESVFKKYTATETEGAVTE